MKFRSIIEGKINRIRGKEIPYERLKECLTCEHNIDAPIRQIKVKDDIEGISGKICGKCSCPLPDKLRSTDESCPIGKW